MKVAALGSPGVGKGTYTTILAEKYEVPRISTGDLFRKIIKEHRKGAKELEAYIIHGALVPDDLVIHVVKTRLQQDDCTNGFFLDGFPRTVAQAQAFEAVDTLEVVLNFIAPDQRILFRLGGRRTCHECGAIYHIEEIPPKNVGICDLCGGKLVQRSDETPHAIRTRLAVYRDRTEPVLSYFRRQGRLVDIDANYPFEQIDTVIAQCDRVLAERAGSPS